MRTLLVLPFALLPLLSGCLAVAAGGVAGLVASQEMLDSSTYVSHINQDVRAVWPQVKMFLADASMDLIQVDDEVRLAKAKIDGATVSVNVEAYDLDKTVMRVSAKRYGVADGEMAKLIMERIHRRLGR